MQKWFKRRHAYFQVPKLLSRLSSKAMENSGIYPCPNTGLRDDGPAAFPWRTSLLLFPPPFVDGPERRYQPVPIEDVGSCSDTYFSARKRREISYCGAFKASNGTNCIVRGCGGDLSRESHTRRHLRTTTTPEHQVATIIRATN